MRRRLAFATRQTISLVTSDTIKTMRIIGIDPGTGILGFGVVDVNGGKARMVTAGVITTPAHTPLDERLEEIFDGLTDIIAETKPEVMSIEKLFFAQNVTTAMSVSPVTKATVGASRVPMMTLPPMVPPL